MANTSLVITANDAFTGNQKTITIPKVNPEATDNALLVLAQKTVTSLTSDSYSKCDRVDKRNLDTEAKPARPITNIIYRIAGSGSGGYSSPTFPTDSDTVDITQSKLYGYSRFFITVVTPTPSGGKLPFCEVSSNVENDLCLSSLNVTTPFRPNDKNVVVWDIDSWPRRATPLDPQLVTVRLVIPEDDTYAHWERTINFNIVADE